jgi:hypothetical protein
MLNAYLVTSIPSYLAAYPSRDLIVAAHQQITHEWWHNARHHFNFYISEAVLEELRKGDPEAAERRLKIVENISVLQLNENVSSLVRIYDKKLGLSGSAKADLPHFAFTVAYKMDYLITWNCSHIANGEIMRRLLDINLELGLFLPLIVTPEEIFESANGG